MTQIAVAATAPFGADVLERLAARHDVALLLTRADKPRGRGRKLAPTPAKEAAERLGIPVEQPARLDEDVELPVHTVVVAAYGLLIPEPLLSRALWLNVHPSLLPRWRGAAVHAAARPRRHLRGEDPAGGPRARPHAAGARGRQPHPCPVAAHRRARRRRRAAADRLARPRRGRRRHARAARGATRGRAPDA